jgi:hypothetical protein
MEMYYINQIIGRGIHLSLVELIKEIKTSLEQDKEIRVQTILLKSKNEKYFKLLRKILKFLGKIIQEEGYQKKILKEVIFDLWGFFFLSQSNLIKESDQINKFVKTFFEKNLSLVDTEIISEFLITNIPKMENCVFQEFFNIFEKLILFVNEKHGKVEKDEVVLDGGYFNDYSSKKLDFHVLKVPSEELDFFNEMESLFLNTKNPVLENFLCSFICTLITKPTYASSETDTLYEQEKNKMIHRGLEYLNKLAEPASIQESEFTIKDIPQTLVYKIKYVQLINRAIGIGESMGGGNLFSFASLREGVPLLLHFEKENTYSNKTTSKFFFNNW